MSRHGSGSPYRSETNAGTFGAFQLQLVVERQEKRKLEEEVTQLKIALEEETRKSYSFEDRWKASARECAEMEDLFVRQSHSKADALRESSGALTSELDALERELEVTRHALMDANNALSEERRKREAIEFDTNTSQRFVRSRYDTEIDNLQMCAEETAARGRLERQANFTAWSILSQMANDIAFEFSVAIKAARANTLKETSRREVTEVLSRGEYESKVGQMQRAIGELTASVDQGDKSILELHKALDKERRENEQLRGTVTEMRGNNQTLREQLSAKTERAMLQSAIAHRTAEADKVELSLRLDSPRRDTHQRHTERRPTSGFDQRDVSPPRQGAGGGRRSSSLYTPIDASILSPSPRGPTNRDLSMEMHEKEQTLARAIDETRRLRGEVADKDTEISRLLDTNTLHGQNVQRLQKERDMLKTERDDLSKENAVLTKSIVNASRHNVSTNDSWQQDASDRVPTVASIRNNRYADAGNEYTSRVFDEAGWNQQVMVLSKDVTKLRKDNAQLKELLRLQETQLSDAHQDSIPREVHTSEVRKWKKFVTELQQVQEDIEGQLVNEKQKAKKLQKRLDDALSDPSSSSLEKLQRKHDLLITEMSEVKAENATLKAMQHHHQATPAAIARTSSGKKRHHHDDYDYDQQRKGGRSSHKSTTPYRHSSTSTKYKDPMPTTDHYGSRNDDPYFQAPSIIASDDSQQDDLVKDIQALTERNTYLEKVLERQEAQVREARNQTRVVAAKASPPRSVYNTSVSSLPVRAEVTSPIANAAARRPPSSKLSRYDNVTDSPPRPRPLTGHMDGPVRSAGRAAPNSSIRTPVHTTTTPTPAFNNQRTTTMITAATTTTTTPRTPGRRAPPSSGIVGVDGPPTVGITPLPPAHFHRLPGGSPEATKRFQAAQPHQLSESLQHQFKKSY